MGLENRSSVKQTVRTNKKTSHIFSVMSEIINYLLEIIMNFFLELKKKAVNSFKGCLCPCYTGTDEEDGDGEEEDEEEDEEEGDGESGEEESDEEESGEEESGDEDSGDGKSGDKDSCNDESGDEEFSDEQPVS